MKTLVLFYSYSGHTKAIAEKLASDGAFDIIEIEDAKKPGKLLAYSKGCFYAIRGKPWPIKSLKIDLTAYDKLILLSPVWAGNPPPAVNALLDILPEEKNAAVKMISSSGKSACRERLETIFKANNCKLDDFVDIKA
jgi:flavodoxin